MQTARTNGKISLSEGETQLDPDLSPGYQVRGAHRRFDRLLNAYLNRHQLKTGFWYYLRVLWLQDGVTQKYLSDMTNVTENTTVSLINSMVRQGLVKRTRDADDRRKLRITLTDQGRALEKELMHYAADINRIAVEGIEPSDVATCISVLHHMSVNLAAEFDKLPEKPLED